MSVFWDMGTKVFRDDPCDCTDDGRCEPKKNCVYCDGDGRYLRANFIAPYELIRMAPRS